MKEEPASSVDSGEEPSKETVKVRLTPGARLVPFALGGVPLALLDVALGGGGLGLVAALAYDAVVLGLAAFEGKRIARDAPSVERLMDRRLVVGIENRIRIRLRNPSARALRVTVRDDVPAGFVATPDELRVELPGHARRELEYKIVPDRRGRHEFGDIHLKVEGGAGLGASIVTQPAKETARVFPNVLGPRRYELAARLGDLGSVGVRSVRRGGGGGEFEQLREYVSGDPYRDVDHKSTAKRRRPITRVFDEERSQIVLVAIDAGRMMAPRLGPISKLDHAINAALLLCWVALKKGDRAGLIVFGDQVSTFVPPARGPGQYRRLLEALYGIEAKDTFVDFRRLAEFVQARARKRALLVLFSDLLDEAHATPLAQHIALLGRRHLPVCVTMHDPVANELADRAVESESDAYRRAAAADLLEERDAIKVRLKRSGVGLVEAPPGELAIAIVNRYLSIKAGRRL